MNKLGLPNQKDLDVEKQLVNFKLNIIDETFTFNREMMDFVYLKRLNKFLFSDLYYEFQSGTRIMNNEERKKVDDMLLRILEICLYEPENIEDILNIIQELWELQLFYEGNTRTLFAYLKILNSAFSLGLNINPNIDIDSKSSFFNTENFVNQKRLTKTK